LYCCAYILTLGTWIILCHLVTQNMVIKWSKCVYFWILNVILYTPGFYLLSFINIWLYNIHYMHFIPHVYLLLTLIWINYKIICTYQLQKMLTSNNQGDHKFGEKNKTHWKLEYYTNNFHVRLSTTVFDSHVTTKFILPLVLNRFNKISNLFWQNSFKYI